MLTGPPGGSAGPWGVQTVSTRDKRGVLQELQRAVSFCNMERFPKMYIQRETRILKCSLSSLLSPHHVLEKPSMTLGGKEPCSYFCRLQPSCRVKHLSPLKCAFREASGLGDSGATARPPLRWTTQTRELGRKPSGALTGRVGATALRRHHGCPGRVCCNMP